MKEIPENRKSGPTEILSLYVLYDHPLDYPTSYVVRRQTVDAGSGAIRADVWPFLVGPGVEALRSILRGNGLTNIGRMEGDDPVILEVWI